MTEENGRVEKTAIPGKGSDTEVAEETFSEKHLEEMLGSVPIVEMVTSGAEAISDHIPPIGVDREKGVAYVLDVELPLRTETSPNTPSPVEFQGYTLDVRTLGVLQKIATAIKLKDPCLLEGMPATSKTSGVRFLAMVTGHEVRRVNLSGDTDMSELIGKYAPTSSTAKAKFEQIMSNEEMLSSTSRETLQKAREEERVLTLEETKEIAEREGIESAEWVWQDGDIPYCMKNGAWLILDEINMGRGGILEGLNSVLERHPSLNMENGEKIGNNGSRQLHEDFRVFGTMNPSDLGGGRIPLTEAMLDRFISRIMVERPTAECYEDMMELLVYGKQPDVVIDGIKYSTDQADPIYPNLATIPNFEKIITRVAKVHEKISDMARDGVIGKEKADPYTFTRRALIEMLDFMSDMELVDRRNNIKVSINEDPKKIILKAIEYTYTDKLLPRGTEGGDNDRDLVKDVLESLNLSPETWNGLIPDPDILQPGEITYQLSDGTRATTNGELVLGSVGLGDQFKYDEYYASSQTTHFKPRTKYTLIGIIDDEKVILKNSEGEISAVTASQVLDYLKKIDVEELDVANGRVEEYLNKSYRMHNGSNLRSTGLRRLGGLSVGDIVRPNDKKFNGFGYELRNRGREVTLVGFTAEEYPLYQMSDGTCFHDDTSDRLSSYEVVGSVIKKETTNAKVVRSESGKTIVINTDIEKTSRCMAGQGIIFDIEAAQNHVGVISPEKVYRIEGFALEEGAVYTVIETGGGKHLKINIKLIDSIGRLIGKTIKGSAGGEIQMTASLVDPIGCKVGQELEAKNSEDEYFESSVLRRSQKYMVAGFTEDGHIVVELDDGTGVIFSSVDIEDHFTIVK